MADGDKLQYRSSLSPGSELLARTELNEDPSTRLLELKVLKDRLLHSPGLRPQADAGFLVRFLRARKFDQEETYKLILQYYKMRKDDPEVFVGLRPSCVAHVYRSKLSWPHRHRDRSGAQIYLAFPGRMDASSYTPTEIFRAEYLDLQKLIQDEENQVRGFTLLLDYKDFTMGQFLKLNMDFAKRMAKLWQDAFPARLKNVLIVNEPHFMDMMLGFFTQFMKTKVVGRIQCIGTDWKRLHEYIDPGYLPAAYGGTMEGALDPETWFNEMLDSDASLEEDCKYGFVDYTITKESSKVKEDAIVNMVGTFKRLNV